MSEVIRAEDIHKIFRMGDVEVHALQGVNLTIQRGEFIAIMGSSGSGKSTFMNILGCLDRPTTGRYFLEGQEVGSLSRDQWAQIRNRRIGFVFQGFNLLSRTSALENVELPMMYDNSAGRRRHDRAVEVLSLVGLQTRLQHMPNQLSGGQQQRLCIARALATGPEVLLMDEPASALDPASTARIEDLIFELKVEYTIVIVTHNMQQAARVSDQTAFFYQGTLVEVGPTTELFTNPKDRQTEDYITGRFG